MSIPMYSGMRMRLICWKQIFLYGMFKNLRSINIESTMIYLHVTTQAQVDSNDKVSKVMQGVLS